MTTPEPLGDGSQEPRPAYSQPPFAPTYPGATVTLPPQPPLPKKSSGLALASLIVGIVAFLAGWVPVFGALIGVAAVVLGIFTLRKRQSKGMAITGIVLGAVALLTSILMTISVGVAMSNPSAFKSTVATTQSASPTPAKTVAPTPVASPTQKSVETVAPTPVKTTAPVQETTAPVAPAPAAPAPAPVAPAVSAEYKSALAKATSYSEMMQMSKAGVYDQLTSEYGEQFSPEAAQYAIDNVQADWNANALAKGKSYQSEMSMSPAAIHDQLTSEYGEKFTAAEADYAILHLND